VRGERFVSPTAADECWRQSLQGDRTAALPCKDAGAVSTAGPCLALRHAASDNISAMAIVRSDCTGTALHCNRRAAPRQHLDLILRPIAIPTACAKIQHLHEATEDAMWSNRKARFTIIWAIILGANLALWLAHQGLGYTMKDHPNLFSWIILFDLVVLLALACLGLLASWLLAFRPELYMRTIERSIARRNVGQT